MNLDVAGLRQHAAEHPLLGDGDPPPIAVIRVDNGQWAVGLSLNR